jgi:hypothetical protein
MGDLQQDANSDMEKSAQELANLKLAGEKLRIELEDLARPYLFRNPGLFTASITAIGALAAAALLIYNNYNQVVRERNQLEEEKTAKLKSEADADRRDANDKKLQATAMRSDADRLKTQAQQVQQSARDKIAAAEGKEQLAKRAAGEAERYLTSSYSELLQSWDVPGYIAEQIAQLTSLQISNPVSSLGWLPKTSLRNLSITVDAGHLAILSDVPPSVESLAVRVVGTGVASLAWKSSEAPPRTTQLSVIYQVTPARPQPTLDLSGLRYFRGLRNLALSFRTPVSIRGLPTAGTNPSIERLTLDCGDGCIPIDSLQLPGPLVALFFNPFEVTQWRSDALKNVERLTFYGIEPMNPFDRWNLGNLSNLRSLSIPPEVELSPADFSALAQYHKLTDLTIGFLPAQDTLFPGIEHLACSLDGHGYSFLKSFPNLKTLDAQLSNGSEALGLIAQLARDMPKLRGLKLRFVGPVPVPLAFSQLANLERLDLTVTSGAAVRDLRTLGHLRELNLDGEVNVEASDLLASRQLVSLSIRHSRVASLIETLPSLTTLKVLILQLDRSSAPGGLRAWQNLSAKLKIERLVLLDDAQRISAIPPTVKELQVSSAYTDYLGRRREDLEIPFLE